MPKRKVKVNADEFNWLTPNQEGRWVLVTGHWSGDFQGVVGYGGRELAIIVDSDGNQRTICYIKPVEFHLL